MRLGYLLPAIDATLRLEFCKAIRAIADRGSLRWKGKPHSPAYMTDVDAIERSSAGDCRSAQAAMFLKDVCGAQSPPPA